MMKLNVILLVLLIYTCILTNTADEDIKENIQDVDSANNEPDGKQDVDSMENTNIHSIDGNNWDENQDSKENILNENSDEMKDGIDSDSLAKTLNSEKEDIVSKEGAIVSEKQIIESEKDENIDPEISKGEDIDSGNVPINSGKFEDMSEKEVYSKNVMNSEKDVDPENEVDSEEESGLGKETDVSHETDTNNRNGEQEEIEDPSKLVIINKVLVVKDNVSGHKHSSFSEDKSTNRGDELTLTQVKEEAEKRILEKEKEKEMNENDPGSGTVPDEPDEHEQQEEPKVLEEPEDPEEHEVLEEPEVIETDINDDTLSTQPEKPSDVKDDDSSTQPETHSGNEDNDVSTHETSSDDTKANNVDNADDAKLNDHVQKSTISSENDGNTMESQVEPDKQEEQPEKEIDNTDNEGKVPHSSSSDDKSESPPSETLSSNKKSDTVVNAGAGIGVATFLGSEEIEIKETSKSASKKEKKVQPGADLYNEANELLKTGKKDVKKAYKLLAEAADLNNTDAAEKIAYPYLFGDNIKRNKTKAIELFHSMAEKGIPLGQQGLGFVYGAGLNVNSSQAKALIYTTFGALGGNAMAHMMLGYRYFNGIGVAKSCESALTHYKKVAKKVTDETTSHGGNAVQRVRLYDELEQPGGTSAQIDEDLLQYYQFLADKGDLQAQVGLGQLYFQGGRGIDVNYEKAFKYFQLAGDVDNGNGLAYLGKMHLDGLHVKKDQKKAFQYFTKAAGQSNPIGQAGLGMIYLKGAGVKKDYDQAMKYFSQAAEQGWVEGQLQLGNMYYNGIGVKKDYRQAVKYFTFASQSGHVMAFYNLASMHATGAGVMRSCNTAAELFKNVAERGKWSMMFMDAYDSYRAGDLETALLKYYYLAELGYEVAQSNVAYVLEKGELSWFSQNQTYARALLQWSRAAVQGYAVARVKVGDYHFYGYGTKIDYDTAALHYRMASDQQNNPQAMFNLGYMHEQGFGLKEDIHLAKRFYDMAAEASPDAHFPVTLALLKLTMHFTLEWMQKNYRFWEYAPIERLKVYTLQKLGPDWDMYLITVLAIILGGLLLFRRTLRR